MLTLLYIDSAFFVLSVCLRLTWSVIEWLLGPLLWWRRSFSILLIVPFPLWAIFLLFSAVRRWSTSNPFVQHLKIAYIYVLFGFIDSVLPSAVTDSPLCPFVWFFLLFFSLTFLILLSHVLFCAGKLPPFLLFAISEVDVASYLYLHYLGFPCVSVFMLLLSDHTSKWLVLSLNCFHIRAMNTAWLQNRILICNENSPVLENNKWKPKVAEWSFVGEAEGMPREMAFRRRVGEICVHSFFDSSLLRHGQFYTTLEFGSRGCILLSVITFTHGSLLAASL